MTSLAMPRVGRFNPTAYGWSIILPVLILCLVGLSCIYATEAGLDPSAALRVLCAAAYLILLGIGWRGALRERTRVAALAALATVAFVAHVGPIGLDASSRSGIVNSR